MFCILCPEVIPFFSTLPLYLYTYYLSFSTELEGIRKPSADALALQYDVSKLAKLRMAGKFLTQNGTSL
jgi:hypothetical protein